MYYQFLAALLTPALPAAPAVARAQDTTYAFVNVAVVPMDSARILPEQTVLVRGGRIVALGRAGAVAVPAGAQRIDGRGKYLIPGLADMHVHPMDTTGAELYAYVANGVTTIRAMGFYSDAMRRQILTLRARAATGELMSPRIYAATDPVSSVEEVEQGKARGFDLVKLYGFDGPLLDSVAAAAHQLGIPIAGHAPENLQRAVDVGYASTEHLAGFTNMLGASADWWGLWGNSALSPHDVRQLVADSARLRRIAAALKQGGVWTCPTSAMFAKGPLGSDEWPELRYTLPENQTQWRAQLNNFVDTVARAVVEARGAVVKALHDAGAGLLLGTDTGVPYMLPGFAVHRELEAFVRAGLTPYDALATGTRNVAAYFGTLDSTGTVAVGKRADLVLLAGNPLADIGQTRHPAGVMLGGRWLDRAALDRGLAALEGQLTSMGN